MVETPSEELTLRDILEILKRQKVWILTLPLLFGAVALIYGFFIAEPTYASTATLSVAPVQVQAQLEQRIQVQQATPITFEGLKALALSEEVVGGVWEALRKEGRLPTRWQDQGNLRGVERMLRDLQVKDISPRVQAANPNQVPPIVATFTVKAPDPQVAAKAANLWVEAVKRKVNEIPLQRLKASLLALEEQVAPAEKAYREAQARWEAFQKATTLAQDKAELEAKTGERVSLDQELSGLERDLSAVRGRIEALSREADRQARLVPLNTSPEQLAIIGKRLQEAQTALKGETEKARQAYLAAAKALEAFKERERIAEWQNELNRLSGQLAEIGVRLAQIATEQASREASLREVEAALAKEPKVLDVVREVVADPVLAAAVAKGDLSALIGLRLSVQEVNPVYAPLLTQAVNLRSQIKALEAEEQALLKEQEAIFQRISSLKKLLSAQEREKEAITLEYNTKKAAYEALRSRYDQIATLTAQDLAFDNPNPEYQRLRSALIDAQAEEARLLARKAALQARIAQVDARIGILKDRVARAQVEQDTLSQALELAKNAYLALAQKRTDLNIQIASNQEAWASILAPAYPIYEKVAPRRGLLFALAVALGLMLGVMAAFIAEALRPQEAPSRGSA
ncbi:chain length determinant protein [Thermus thermophilus]|uniref:Wzz/FepE/Etk N-terminal domain-containing protein n=1 Tax=Thermus thermophilus TaxID=274 RepID=UPI00090C5539|nr:Wzz/FepE/Etk N-terminal domain-containing protein [Thermus thermophilus]BAW01143.1 chain length determinant protein [Thermus thermophilus]BDB11811.1 chain-length determining protein [Thermus thermophilus]